MKTDQTTCAENVIGNYNSLGEAVDRRVSLRKTLDMAALELVNMVFHLYSGS